jgi:UDP-N-acetyl-D-galactosamine dehydrogenase
MRETISIIGCGYIGLPLTERLSRFYNTKAFDIDKDKINNLKNNRDLSNIIQPKFLKKLNTKKVFTSDESEISNSDYYIVCVPTPVTQLNRPDLKNLIKATKIVARNIKKGSIIIFESTVYPGCTNTVCVPILEKAKKYKINKDFFCGYSPERINPADKYHTLKNTNKIISASNKKSLKKIKKLYSKIVSADLHMAESIEIAEAAKIIENIQRDLNIALFNELKIIFDKMSIPSKKVFDAASTKWNFIKFRPGLVGGHCIGVDPYYLTYKAKKIGILPKVILSGRKINNDMSKYVFLKILTYKKKIKKALFFGCTFKENVSDVRNSKVFDLAKLFKKNKIPFDVYDPIANLDNKVKKIYNFTSSVKNLKQYDLIVFAVKHKGFLEGKIKSIIKKNVNSQAVIIDLCDITENLKIKSHYKL